MLGNLNTQYRRRDVSDDPRRETNVSNDQFKSWGSGHMYRTSSRDMSKRYPCQASKKQVIPGYQGHVPGEQADENFSKSKTQISRDQLNRAKFLGTRSTELFPAKPFKLTLQGTTLGKFGGGLQDEYHCVSRMHGKSTIPMSHPNYSQSTWTSVTKSTYTPQEAQRAGKMFRTTNTGSWKSSTVCARPSTSASGFVQNSNLFDGHTWVPIKKLHGDMSVTEYRGRHNPTVPFHPNPLQPNVRKLKAPQYNY